MRATAYRSLLVRLLRDPDEALLEVGQVAAATVLRGNDRYREEDAAAYGRTLEQSRLTSWQWEGLSGVLLCLLEEDPDDLDASLLHALRNLGDTRAVPMVVRLLDAWTFRLPFAESTDPKDLVMNYLCVFTRLPVVAQALERYESAKLNPRGGLDAASPSTSGTGAALSNALYARLADALEDPQHGSSSLGPYLRGRRLNNDELALLRQDEEAFAGLPQLTSTQRGTVAALLMTLLEEDLDTPSPGWVFDALRLLGDDRAVVHAARSLQWRSRGGQPDAGADITRAYLETFMPFNDMAARMHHWGVKTCEANNSGS